MIATEPTTTAQRQSRLDQYYARHVMLDGKFCCGHFTECRASHSGPYFEGQAHYVGDHFDAKVDGVPMRIVVVGQEYGHGPALTDATARAKMIQGSAHAPRGFADRNPHMKGTTHALRVLFGRTPGVDPAGETLDVGRVQIHLFDAFALVNLLLCSATDGTARGRATDTMLSNCLHHFTSVMEVLQPTVLVCQGKGFFWYVAEALGVPKKKESVFSFRCGGVDGFGVCLNHPSTPRWEWAWANPAQPYLAARVLPLLNEVRDRMGLGPVEGNGSTL
ncbi:MAG: hypothetical protein RBS57_07960 [Desulforhabdus sp.]|jgi:hypothetical protein|nr:hypothetical protein [Desulforhabdus sp.]